MTELDSAVVSSFKREKDRKGLRERKRERREQEEFAMISLQMHRGENASIAKLTVLRIERSFAPLCGFVKLTRYSINIKKFMTVPALFIVP